jgi:hypothetical protein
MSLSNILFAFFCNNVPFMPILPTNNMLPCNCVIDEMELVLPHSKEIYFRITPSVFYIRLGNKKPMTDDLELELCSTCQKDYLRPTGNVHVMGGNNITWDTAFACNFCGQKSVNEHLEVINRADAVHHIN